MPLIRRPRMTSSPMAIPTKTSRSACMPNYQRLQQNNCRMDLNGDGGKLRPAFAASLLAVQHSALWIASKPTCEAKLFQDQDNFAAIVAADSCHEVLKELRSVEKGSFDARERFASKVGGAGICGPPFSDRAKGRVQSKPAFAPARRPPREGSSGTGGSPTGPRGRDPPGSGSPSPSRSGCPNARRYRDHTTRRA